MNQEDIYIICNPVAGEGLAIKRWEKFQHSLEEKNISYTLHITASKNHATALAKTVIKSGARRIVSFGGDGTFNEILQCIAPLNPGYHGDVDLVFLGAGSSNDFEKKFSDILPWIERVTSSRTKAIDLCRVDCIGFDGLPVTRYFVNNSSIGVISLGGEYFNEAKGITRLLKQKSADAGAILSGLKAIARYRPLVGDLIIDGNIDKNRPLSNVTIYKTGHFGGGMKYNQCTEPDDGKLSVAIVDGVSKLKLLGIIPTLYTGTIFNKAYAHYKECEWFEVQTDQKISIETDGEIIGHTPARYTILKQAVRVVV